MRLELQRLKIIAVSDIGSNPDNINSPKSVLNIHNGSFDEEEI
jgi:hypothetical protein